MSSHDYVETYTVESENLTVSLMVWRRYKRPMPGLVERIYEHNYDLAESGHYLPLGATVEIPITIEREPQLLDPIKLWDY